MCIIALDLVCELTNGDSLNICFATTLIENLICADGQLCCFLDNKQTCHILHGMSKVRMRKLTIKTCFPSSLFYTNQYYFVNRVYITIYFAIVFFVTDFLKSACYKVRHFPRTCRCLIFTHTFVTLF